VTGTRGSMDEDCHGHLPGLLLFDTNKLKLKKFHNRTYLINIKYCFSFGVADGRLEVRVRTK